MALLSTQNGHVNTLLQHCYCVIGRSSSNYVIGKKNNSSDSL